MTTDEHEATRAAAYPNAAWLLIEVGCAECRGWDEGEALVTIQGVYPTAQAAKDAYEHTTRAQKWFPHPQGGEFVGFGSGDVWVAPVTAFTEPKIMGDLNAL